MKNYSRSQKARNRETKTKANGPRNYANVRLSISTQDRDLLRAYTREHQVTPEFVLMAGMKELGIR